MQKIDKKLLNFVAMSQSECTIECIVYYTDKNKLLDFFKKNKVRILKKFSIINAYAVCFNSNKIFQTAKQSFVSYISSVTDVKTLIDVSKKIINVDDTNLSGKGVTIAFIDTGINSHLDFKLGENRIIKFCDFVNDCQTNYDDNGHGTFVAGVACGSGIESGKKYSGIAPMANIVSLKALNEKGEATAVTILDAMQWLYENHKQYGIKIVCMSFGSEPLGINDPIMKGAEML